MLLVLVTSNTSGKETLVRALGGVRARITLLRRLRRRLTKEMIEERGVPMPQALALLRQCLPRNAVIVGQNISKDVQWLGLREGQDFAQMLDLTGLYRIWNERYKSFSVFGQDHLAKVLLGWETQAGGHDAGARRGGRGGGARWVGVGGHAWRPTTQADALPACAPRSRRRGQVN